HSIRWRRSSCTKHPLRGASIAGSDKEATAWGSRHSLGHLQVDRVALHLIVKRGTLNAEQFGCLFLVAPRFCKRLEYGLAFQFVESLYAFARQAAELGLL